MIALTIATPDYLDLATKNAGWFHRHSGLDVLVHLTSRDGFAAKLELEKLVHGPVVFFDADYRLLRDSREFFSTVDTNEFHGVHETVASNGKPAHFPYSDSRAVGMPPENYINTGFFICNTRRHGHVFQRARQLMAEKQNGLWAGIADTTEQSILNLALHREGIVPVMLPTKWNFFQWAHTSGCCDFPRRVIGFHAAGVVGPAAKAEHLDAFSRVLV